MSCKRLLLTQTVYNTIERNINGCIYSLDWTTGLDYWTGLLDSPLIPKMAVLNLAILELCYFEG